MFSLYLFSFLHPSLYLYNYLVQLLVELLMNVISLFIFLFVMGLFFNLVLMLLCLWGWRTFFMANLILCLPIVVLRYGFTGLSPGYTNWKLLDQQSGTSHLSVEIPLCRKLPWPGICHQNLWLPLGCWSVFQW